MSHMIFLVELLTAVRVRDWKSESPPVGTYSRKLDNDMVVLTRVEENGTAMIEKTSTADVDATANTWYYDLAARRLYIHTSDNGDANAKTLVATILEPLMKGGSGGGMVKTRSGVDLFWENRVVALPTVDQRITPDELGAGSVATFGELLLNNLDGRYDRLLGQRLFAGQTATILRGELTAAYSTFTTWIKANQMEPAAELALIRIPLVSLGRRLDRPIISSIYSTADFADLDPNVIGFNRPKVWGSVKGAEAFRVATCQWEVANHALTCFTLSSAKTALGVAVCTTCQDLANGRFHAATSYADTEARLYVDCRGVAKNTPGELIVDLGKDFGLSTSADMDGSSLSTLDSDRAVSVGFQIRGGSYADALDLVARSAFVDWYVDRSNLLGGRIRKRDTGNKISNPGFETDASGWTGRVGASVARTTAFKFRGSASLEITKSCGSSNSKAEAVGGNLSLKAGKSYTVTLLAALSCAQASAVFKIGLSDGGGTCGGANVYLSDAFTLSSCEWSRVTHDVKGFLRDAIFWSSTSIVMSSQSITFAGQGGEFVIRPQDEGVESIRTVVDEVELVEAIALTEQNSDYRSGEIAGPILYRVRAGYAFDGRLQTRRFAQKSDTLTQRLFPISESRQVDSYLVCATHAETVAQAILDYFSALRVRSVVELLSPEDEPQVGIASVMDQQTTRRPTLPGAGRLYRVTALSESHPADQVPRLRLEGEAQTDPIFKIEAISVT